MKSAVFFSLYIHLLGLLLFGGILFLSGEKEQPRRIRVDVKEVIKITDNSEKAKPEIKLNSNVKPKPQSVPKVFGLSNKTVEGGKNASVQIKAGNTIAKEIDQEKVKPEDADPLPIPTEEYLISQMPRLKSEFRIPYPPEARQKNIEGVVVMDILIDEKGKVRAVDLINGPGYGLNEAALSAIYKFEFAPASVDNKPVAVRIRYSYRFVLN